MSIRSVLVTPLIFTLSLGAASAQNAAMTGPNGNLSAAIRTLTTRLGNADPTPAELEQLGSLQTRLDELTNATETAQNAAVADAQQALTQAQKRA